MGAGGEVRVGVELQLVNVSWLCVGWGREGMCCALCVPFHPSNMNKNVKNRGRTGGSFRAEPEGVASQLTLTRLITHSR